MPPRSEAARRQRREDDAGRRERNAPARYRARQDRAAERAAAGQPRRSEDATSIAEALEIEREAGRREGAAAAGTNTPAPASSGPRFTLPRASGIPSVSAPLLVGTALITADELVTARRFPLPSRLLIAWGFFGVLGMVSGPAEPAATATAWGIVVAMFYAKAPIGKPPALRALDAIGDFIAGGNKTGAAANAVGSLNAGANGGPTSEAGPLAGTAGARNDPRYDYR